jgi:hypothetical protein
MVLQWNFYNYNGLIGAGDFIHYSEVSFIGSVVWLIAKVDDVII